MRIALAAFVAFLGSAGILTAQQPSRYELPASERTGSIRRISVLCHSHLDIGFTRPPDEVARDYKENIDEAIRLTRENADFRWTIESAWMLEEWLRRTTDPARIAELGAMLREGKMGLGVAFANMHSGLMAAEETNRLVYLGHQFRKRWGLNAAVAFQNDVPGFTWAYPRVFSGSGVSRLITGLNLFIGGGNSLGVSKNPFYWIGPDGSRVLTYFTYDSYVEGYRWKLGARFPVAELEQLVPRRLAWLEKNGYKYDTYLLMASPGDNISPVAAFGTLQRIREWNTKHPELPMRMTTAEEFFDDLRKRYKDDFPEVAGDTAGHWETVKLRVPEAAGKMRQVSNLLPVTETAAALSSLLTKRTYPLWDLREAWYSLLSFHEHTADAGGGWPGYFSRSDADWSNTAFYAAALNGFSNTEQILRRSVLRLAVPGEEHSLMNPARSSADAATVVVYNGLSWVRSGPVLVDHLPASLREGPLAVTDLASGKQVPTEDVPGTKRMILLFPENIPAVGYKTYRVTKSEAANEFNRLPFPVAASLDSAGFIASIEDGGRKLVPPDAAQPIGRILLSRENGEFRPDSTGAPHVSVQDGAITRRIEIRRAGSVLPLQVITSYRGAHYIDLRFDVDLDLPRGPTSSNVRLAVSLPFRSAKTYIDGAGFVLRVPEDILPGGKAPQVTPVHFVRYDDRDGWGATVANIDAAVLRADGAFLLSAESLASDTREEGLVRLFRTEPRSSPVQSFRFRIAVQENAPEQWKRFGAEANVPLRAVTSTATPAVAQRGFFELSDARVQLIAFKPSEIHPGLHVLRLQESSGQGATGVRLQSALKFGKALAANLVEEPTETALNLGQLEFRPWETKTILVEVSVPE